MKAGRLVAFRHSVATLAVQLSSQETRHRWKHRKTMTTIQPGAGDKLPFVFDDGGRAASGFRGQADDCVVRAVAIASALPYAEVYQAIAKRRGRRAWQ
jgi:hypothetical protein